MAVIGLDGSRTSQAMGALCKAGAVRIAGCDSLRPQRPQPGIASGAINSTADHARQQTLATRDSLADE